MEQPESVESPGLVAIGHLEKSKVRDQEEKVVIEIGG